MKEKKAYNIQYIKIIMVRRQRHSSMSGQGIAVIGFLTRSLVGFLKVILFLAELTYPGAIHHKCCDIMQHSHM